MTTDYAHRYIDQSLCFGCGDCITICPMDAIVLDNKASIDADECVECGVCSRSRICPVDAIKEGDLKWPRVLRGIYSNPLAKHEGTEVYGRGTEGIKTNDSQNFYEPGTIGVVIELGRPVLGARFRDVERVLKKFKSHGYSLAPHSPVVALIEDPQAGSLKPEILPEKVMSCIVEFALPDNAADELMAIIRELGSEVDTVFNVCVALRADEAGGSPLKNLFGENIHTIPDVKVNIGAALDTLKEQA